MFPDAGGGAGKQVGIWESDGVRKRAGVTDMEGERVREQMARGRRTDRNRGARRQSWEEWYSHSYKSLASPHLYTTILQKKAHFPLISMSCLVNLCIYQHVLSIPTFTKKSFFFLHTIFTD